MYYCGIDSGKHHHEGSVIDENGKALLESLPFSNMVYTILKEDRPWQPVPSNRSS